MTGCRRAGIAALILAALILAGLVSGFIAVRGWGDWSIGTNTHYCGVYWPHLDFYCESAR
jgi:hypothetical protein